ncbi:hypothetical protein [Leucobacter salsicius]|uniref:hypothetical protein n=1 Tax=Leucobacter salsicius TaxID=664638 RepID=UPI00034D57CB|nr:hypothetical protein [Leucobacter salsicius]
MSKSDSAKHDPVTPSRRDRLRPLELVGFSAVLAIFAGLVVMLTTRDWVLALIFLGVAFIVSVMMVALIGLGGKPSDEDDEARKDLQSPDDVWH